MIEGRSAPLIAVGQLLELQDSDVNQLVGLQRAGRRSDRTKSTAELRSRVQDYFTMPERAIFLARKAITAYGEEQADTVEADIVGYEATRINYDEDPSTLHIEHLIIDPSTRGLPLGGWLLNLALRHAHEHKAARVQIDRHPSNAVGQDVLFSMGFKQENWLYNRHIDTWHF